MIICPTCGKLHDMSEGYYRYCCRECEEKAIMKWTEKMIENTIK